MHAPAAGLGASDSLSAVAATAAAIETNGGQVTMEPFEIEQVGTLVMFRDTEGNTVGAMQYLPGVR